MPSRGVSRQWAVGEAGVSVAGEPEVIDSMFAASKGDGELDCLLHVTENVGQQCTVLLGRIPVGLTVC